MPLAVRPVVLATTLLFSLASLGCALAPSLGWLLLCRGLQGLCGGAGLVVGRAIIRDKLDGAEAQRLMSQVTMLFSCHRRLPRWWAAGCLALSAGIPFLSSWR
jgi:MFS family permease